ncbi:MAG: cation:proton antiporter [Bacteroidales bacterium]|nr:cation:proton antiporter [Bacteroidales bacterium]
MGHLPYLISDLALILIVAGLTTLCFKRLKQPLVLGYIVAGMIAGPAITLLPSVQDTANIQIWADIGVLFLLFALGLEFSFKKLLSVGKTVFIDASVEILTLLLVGYTLGRLMGWGNMNSIFLGGMMSMSSTSIIIKTFDDLRLREKPFARLVFGVLVVEDLVAVVLMVLLSTLAGSGEFSAWGMLTSVFRLLFFLALWFLFGIYLIPSFLKAVRPLLSDETLLVVSVGLCLGMVVIAVKVGFSSALGAFIMGSILAESVEAARIERLIKPLKDLFGAVFFVSVGMMVNLSVIVQYIWPILLITLCVIVFKILGNFTGMTLSGQPLNIAVKSGFSLAQIGEFSFIIASLGLSLKVTDNFLYPVAVAVSVITTFVTPYVIKAADPVGVFLEQRLPDGWNRRFLKIRPGGEGPSKNLQDWLHLLNPYLMNLLLMMVVIVGIIMLSMQFLQPFVASLLDEPWAGAVMAAVTLLVMSPFLKSIISNRSKTSGMMMNLWAENKGNRYVLLFLTFLRLMVAFATIAYVLAYFLNISFFFILPLALVLVFAIMRSKRLMRHYWNLESRFVINLNERQMEENLHRIEENKGVREVSDMGNAHWLDKVLYAFSVRVLSDSFLIGKSLQELGFRSKFNLMVIRVNRGEDVLNIPDRTFVFREGDVLTLAGRNAALRLLNADYLNLEFVPDSLMTLHQFSHQEEAAKDNRLCCSGIPVLDNSPMAHKTLSESQIGRDHKCLIIGIERKNRHIVNPSFDFGIETGDLVWVIGSENFVSKLISANVYGL